MHPWRRVGAATIALTVAACSGGSGDDSESAPSTSTTTTVTTTTVSDTPTMTRWPLTGEVTDPSDDPTRAAIVVKIGNNDERAWPQTGLAEADLVVEEYIEGRKTRFATVLHSEQPSRVGPVRSARLSDVDILADLGRPLLAYSGANAFVLGALAEAEGTGLFSDVGFLRVQPPYARDESRSAPDNLYVDLTMLQTARAIDEPRPAPLFEYADPSRAVRGPGGGVTVAYRTETGRVSTHLWDPALGGWVRVQDGALHLAEHGTELVEIAPPNVVVMVVDYVQSPADPESPQAVSFGSGDAWVLSAGRIIEATWQRDRGTVGYRFSDSDGDTIALSAGATWLLFVNSDTEVFGVADVSVHEPDEAAELLEQARASSSGNGSAES